jgi:hypothetical protein
VLPRAQLSSDFRFSIVLVQIRSRHSKSRDHAG